MKRKILHISWFDCAGIIDKFKNAFDKYSDKYEMRSIIITPSILNYSYDMNTEMVDDIECLIKETDIIIIHPFINGGEHINHLMNDWDNMTIQEKNIMLLIFKYNKNIIFFLNGSNNLRRYSNYYNMLLKDIPIMCSTTDLKLTFPNAFYAPVILDLDQIQYTPLNIKKKIESIRITHCPTDPRIKNTFEFEMAVLNLRKKYLFDYKRIFQLPHPIAINVKRSAHINFDHLQGYYGVNSFEAAAQGVINFVKLNNEGFKIFKTVSETDTVPFIHVNTINEFSMIFEHYLQNPKEIEKLSKEFRNWMETYWYPKKLVKRMEKYFDDK